MTSIKPPGGPGSVPAPVVPEHIQGPARSTGPSFHERVAEQQSASTARAVNTHPTQAVIDELRTGRISPAEALQRLTDLAVQRSGAPPALRPTIEAQLRELMSRDPLIQDLIRQMGARISSDQ